MKRRTWVLGFFGVLLLLVAGFFAWIKSVEARRWAALEARVPVLIAEARARDPRRPVLRGEPVPGNAWTDYGAAVKGAFDAKDLSEFLQGSRRASRAKAEGVLQANEGLLDFLRAGARRAEGVYPLRFEKGANADLPSLSTCRSLVLLAICKARFLLEEGKAAEARDLLLDAAQLSADVGRDSVFLGSTVSLMLLGEVFEALKGLPRDPEAARALAVLDGAWPDYGQCMLNEAACVTATLADPEWASTELRGWTSWRYGFSRRIMIADAAELHLELMRQAAAVTREPWAAFLARAASEPYGKNPVLDIVLPAVTGPGPRARLTQLRLLRLALGETAPLDDPYGGALRSDGTKAWSVGQDGIDNGGVGAWAPAIKGDIVLDLKK